MSEPDDKRQDAAAGAVSCPALLVAAPSSGSGKTTVTAGLARLYRRRGLRVAVFKTGPDYLDPMILERAAGGPVYQLDLWMGGRDHCRALLHSAAGSTDVILVEGVMGLHDGSPSAADLARLFGIPVLAVIDGSAMAQTFGALAHGLAAYRPDVPFAGVVANRVGSDDHARMLAESLPEGIGFHGALPTESALALPERHLGLTQAAEIADLDGRLDAAADRLARTQTANLPAPTRFEPPALTEAASPALAGIRVAVARDAAFAFIYPANVDVLRALGADVVFFSPLADRHLPDADALWLPGGYPELHLDALAGNTAMGKAVRAHHRAGKPLLAECGGLLYLLETLTDAEGRSAPMTGVLPGGARLQKRLAAIGMQALDLPEGELRGHAFHYTRIDTPLSPWASARRQHGDRPGEPVYREGALTASYLHLYFPSNPAAVAGLLKPET